MPIKLISVVFLRRAAGKHPFSVYVVCFSMFCSKTICEICAKYRWKSSEKYAIIKVYQIRFRKEELHEEYNKKGSFCRTCGSHVSFTVQHHAEAFHFGA
jgi:hypothetical protein